MRGHRDLERVVIAAVLCALVATLLPWELVRLIAAVPLAVFLPGYAIVSASFASYRLDPQRLLVLVLACGLSVLCLGGIVLDAFPGGIRTLSWALLLVLVVIGAARAAALRRPKAARASKAGPRRSLPKLRPVDLVFGIAALAAAVGALALAYTPLPAGDAAGYTALWMLPGEEGDGEAVRVGVVSAEHDPQAYRLHVKAGKGGKIATYKLELEPGEERVFRVPVPLRASQTSPIRVAASLYEEDRPRELYRRVTTWLPPEEGR
ncbi:MAG TPA: DUF1616 domain-containing protein [Solirubrobacterales bacterium]|nr:DUF1616 domain-containing protein [Solirubrobacterales bacterium]